MRDRSAASVSEFVRSALSPPPARVLEVGAGQGELASELAAAGYDVVAVDPAGEADNVLPIPLLDLDAPPAGFDAAVAVVSLHHVEPLEQSCAHLAALVRPGGRLVVDEFDVDAFDERAAGWWNRRRRELGREEHGDEAATVADLRDHLHSIERIRAALAPAFELSAPERGPYLHRWDLEPELQQPEEDAIARSEIPAVGVRFTGRRRP
jgi:SAM-dependent methyltransferase